MTDEPRDGSADAGKTSDPAPETTQLPPPPTDPSARAYSQVPPAHDDFVPVGSTATFDSPSEAFGAPPSGQFDAPVTTAPAKRHLGKIIGLVSVVVVLLLVIGFASTELYLRHKVKDCLAQSVSSFTGSDADVSLSKKPMLLQGFSGDFPFVQIDSKDNADSKSTLHLRLDDVSSGGDASTIGKIAGNGSLAFDRVVELMKKSQTSANGGDTSNTDVAEIKGNAAAGTVTIDSTFMVAFIPVPVSVTVKPEVADGKISFKVVSATAAVFGIPSDFAQGIVDQMSQSMFDEMFNLVKFTSLKVTDTGIDFVVAGDNVTLKQNVSSPSGSCSSLF